MRPVGGRGGGVTKATIDMYHKYTNNSISSHFKTYTMFNNSISEYGSKLIKILC